MSDVHAQLVNNRVRISVNVDNGHVDIEVGYRPNEFAQFLSDQLTIESMPGTVNFLQRDEHKISFGAVSRFFTFSVPVVAQPGTPFTLKLSTEGACNGWFEFGGLHCGADHGGHVEQTYNASFRDGILPYGAAVRS
jgi:hypothetical protein